MRILCGKSFSAQNSRKTQIRHGIYHCILGSSVYSPCDLCYSVRKSFSAQNSRITQRRHGIYHRIDGLLCILRAICVFRAKIFSAQNSRKTQRRHGNYHCILGSSVYSPCDLCIPCEKFQRTELTARNLSLHRRPSVCSPCDQCIPCEPQGFT